MTELEVLDLSRRIHQWIDAYKPELEKDIGYLRRKHAIDPPDDLARSFEALNEEGRLLQIGVVGRVKAGKSSLLNALFFDGRSILPKAATPMTAALTTLTYADSFGAQVRFYSAEDLAGIRDNADRFEKRLAQERHNAIEEFCRRHPNGPAEQDERFKTYVEQKAQRAARADEALAAAHDQWRRIVDSGIAVSDLGDVRQLQAEDTTALADQLLGYVGAHGRLMPFTKSVDIFLPMDSLRDVRIIDTPGLNDPVQSREERTAALLKGCDAIFVVSPAGQFLAEHDLELMSRLSRKEGIQEILLVASQVDNQLHGSARRPTLRASLDAVIQELSALMIGTLQRQKVQQPEIGDTFDRLVQAGTVLHTSGACHGLSERFDQQGQWDSGEHKVWENLKISFPDFFSDADAQLSRSNLDMLANTSALKSALAEVRSKKDRLISARRADLARAKLSGLIALRDDLLQFTLAKYEQVRNTDVNGLKAQKRKITKAMSVTTHHVDVALKECILDFQNNLQRGLKSDVKRLYGEAENEFADATKETSKAHTRVRDSLAARFANWAWGGGHETVTSIEYKVFVTPVLNGLEYFAGELELDLRKTCETATRLFLTVLEKRLTATARRKLEDEIDADIIIQAARAIVSKIKVPSFELDFSIVRQLKPSGGHLRDAQARDFLDAAQGCLQKFKSQVERQIRTFIREVGEIVVASAVADLFQDVQARLDQIGEQVAHMELTLDRLKRMAKDLEAA